MPEIWLRYGTTDVVLDIKFENLANHISSTFQAPQEQDIKTAITSGVPLTDKMLFLGLSGSKAAAKIIMMLAEEASTRGLSFTIDAPHKIASTLRSNLNGIETISINRIGYQSLNERMAKFQNTIIVSSVAYDPLFGFAGAPTTLLRNLLADRMAEAFKARKDNRPAPGVEGDPLKVATSAVESIPAAAAVELVANGDNVEGIHIGSINEAFEKAIAQLQSISAVEAEPAKCAIISASDEAITHSTFASALNSLWNSIHIVKEGGTAILLAETREGIGGGALQMFIEGRLKQEQLQLSPYIDGLEHLLFIEELRLKYEMGLVSTLPHYYAKTKLGFTTYSGTKDVLQKLQEKHGKNFKTLVLSNADITLLKPKAG
jgi:hypothetical protein